VTDDFEGTGANGRVTLRDLHSTFAQLRSEILANLLEERKSRHDLDGRVMGLEVFRAGIEEYMKAEIRRGDDAHEDLEEKDEKLEEALKTLTTQVTKNAETQLAFMQESKEDRMKIKNEMIDLKESISSINKKLLLGLSIIVAVANLLAPIILSIILNMLGIPAA
jgi:hypothetical protein